MRRKLWTAVLAAVVATQWTLFAGVFLMLRSHEERVIVTRQGRNIYVTQTRMIRTWSCLAPANRTSAVLILGGTLRFPGGKSCYVSSVSSRTSATNWGVTRFAENPHGTPAAFQATLSS